MKEPSPMPDVVIDSVFKWAGVETPHRCSECLQEHGGPTNLQLARAQRVLREMKWYGIEGCYGFYWLNMFVGVEPDGYMHT